MTERPSEVTNARPACCHETAKGDVRGSDGGRVLLSVVTPAFNEEVNLPILYGRLASQLAGLGVDWEWVVVDDHSSDRSFSVAESLSSRDKRVKAVRLARNSGSHVALVCGLTLARGNAVVAMAADLQDPPEILREMLLAWHGGAQVVWAVRREREGERASKLAFSQLYYWLMRRIVGMREIPGSGADFFLADRVVVDALKQFGETHVSLFALLTWMGFRQEAVTYVKEARLHGRSGWTLRKKLKLVVDSVTSFSHLPIRFMSYFGLATALLGFGYSGVVIFNALRGLPPQGWSSLMIAVLLVGGVQMTMLGVLGEYLWRALDEARRRPRYLVEAFTGFDGQAEPADGR